MMSKVIYRFSYNGPVLAFDSLICPKWSSEILAYSEQQARRKLACKFKKDNNIDAHARISFPSELLLVETVM